jgi:hypothetical protein
MHGINPYFDSNFTKPDVLALEKVMAATGYQLLEFIKESAGVAPQSLIKGFGGEDWG